MLSAILTLTSGSISWSMVWDGALQRLQGTSLRWNPLLDERLPRLIVLLCTGASLAVAGAVLQALFQNPLASPSILGISCGGSLCVTFVFLLGWHYYPYAISLAAVIGCLLTLVLIYSMAYDRQGTSPATLILAGIALSTLLLAFQNSILYALRDHWELVQIITEWEAGSTTDRNWSHVHMQLPLTLIGLFVCWAYRKEIDMLALGEDDAKNLGVEVNKVRWRLFLSISLLIGGTIASIGIIAFFGLVLPHVLRYLQGSSAQKLIPASILCGAAALTSFDLLLRLSPVRFFSIGNISSILGGIFFIFLLFGTRRTQVQYRS